ncbi:MAG: hypothetical protein U0Q22_14200 [Acidimicrobiales bacterium]
MDARRTSLWLSISGGAALVAAAIYLVSVGWGEVSEWRVGPDGHRVTHTHRTASPFESSPATAVRSVLIVVAVVVVLGLLIRFGGLLGHLFVIAVAGLACLASLMTLFILIIPGTTLLTIAALMAEADRLQRRAASTSGTATLTPHP